VAVVIGFDGCIGNGTRSGEGCDGGWGCIAAVV
jgi:hypothetical protein